MENMKSNSIFAIDERKLGKIWLKETEIEIEKPGDNLHRQI